ncbi:MAG: T9SS type A sorting domain-containing protein [Balneolaceae bacterium]|nr:T9SS type A sorting domain-containing protein [Balneolaceae bacterium]MBO6547046.1 T9SS type A sorting domain-containing protein [Balneolaceae bacterium]MBO6648007.1 T9SS type A sorting domain-containing protein [Balneolaceae bacterium]
MPKLKTVLFIGFFFLVGFGIEETKAFQTFRSISLSLSSPDGSNDNSNKFYFTGISSEGQDGFDGSKLNSLGGSPTIAFVQDFGGEKVLLTQDARALYPDTIQTYELELKDKNVTGSYSLSWNNFVSIPSLWEISLTDVGVDSTIDMRVESSYSFSLPAAVDTVRFQIKINPVNSNREISGNAGWRLLSIPKTGAKGTDISDDGIGAQFTSNTDNATIYTYDDSGVYETVSSDGTVLTDGYGLAVYFFDNTTNGSSELPVMLDVAGDEATSDVTINLNKSIISGGLSHYFTLAGNPFASNYNLNSLSTDAGSLQDNVHFWNNDTGTYEIGDRTSDFIVSPWQGLWLEVENAGTATTATFPISGKTSSDTTATYFSKESKNRGDLTFTLSSETTIDKAIRLSFREYALLGIDRAEASKLIPLSSTYATMAFKSNNRLKSVESLPYNLTEEVKLDLEEQLVGVSGEFTLDWKGFETIPSEWKITFHDYETGANVDMRLQDKYVFTASALVTEKVNPLSILNGPAAIAQKSKSAAARFGIVITPNTTSVRNETDEEPAKFALEQNYPNPFNPSTTINYSIENSGQVQITVYNLMGQKVAELVNETKSAGSHNVTWNASSAASGMYYYRLESNGQTLTQKMSLIK